MHMRFGSICSGIEAVSQAWTPLGWETVFVAETDPFPATVLHYRWGATRPLRPLAPAEAVNEKDRKQRESWEKQLAALPAEGTIPNLGDFTKIETKDYAGDIDLLVGGTPCFTADTMVLTSHGYRRIANLRVGDLVVTHTGRLQKILRTGKKQADNIGKCRIVGRPEFEATANHPFFVSEGKRDHRRKSPTYGKLHLWPFQWSAIGESVGRYAARLNIKAAPLDIAAPIFPEVYAADRRQIMNLIGWYIGDGYIRRFSGQNKKCVILCLNDQKLKHFQELFDGVINYSSTEGTPGVWKVQIANTALADFLLEWFGELSMRKRIPAWLYAIPAAEREAFLAGYEATDGHRTQSGVAFTTVSPALAYGISDLCIHTSLSKVEVPPKKVIQGREVNQRPWYRILHCAEDKVKKHHTNGNYLCSRIKKFIPQCEEGTVYNIEVEHDHSYIANGFCVHNCQAYSVAGLRQGLADPRGNLTLEFARLAGRTCARWLCWENVPGVLSSGKGCDFASFLSLLCGWEVPVPKRGWRKSGIATAAPGCYSVAWRILDAQYIRTQRFHRAVPQRRRRILLVGYRGDWQYPAEVLALADGLRGDSPPGRTPGAGVARALTSSLGGASAKEQQLTFVGRNGLPLNAIETGRGYWRESDTSAGVMPNMYRDKTVICMAHGQANAEISEDQAPTLNCNHEAPIIAATEPPGIPITQYGEIAGTLTSEGSDAAPCADRGPNILCYDARGNGNGDISPTLTGDHLNRVNDYMPVLRIGAFMAGQGSKSWSVGYVDECSPTLRSDGGANRTPTIAIAENIIGRKVENGGNGLGAQEELSYTLNCTGVHGISKYQTVRRMLPVECERLMGMPDNYTLVPWRGKPAEECPDSLRYKALGNSMCVNVMAWIGERIDMVERRIRNH